MPEHAAALPSCFPDELAHAGRENLDVEHVARYDRKEDSDAARELEVLQDAGMPEDAVVVEFGPGTGQFTEAVARACGRVIAVDVSPVMLDRLRARIDAAGIGNVGVVHAGFLSYAHAGLPADVVYTRLALHHLPDFWKVLALRRMFEALRPGGLLRLWDVVYAMEPAETVERIEAWCATGGETVDGEWSRAEYEEHVRDEHSTFTWLFEAMIARTGFESLATESSADGIFRSYLLRRPR